MFILVSALAGAGVTLGALWRFGPAIALLGAPLGGSVAAGVAAVVSAALRPDRRRTDRSGPENDGP